MSKLQKWMYCIIDQYLDGDGGTGFRPDPLGQDTKHGRPFLGRPGKVRKLSSDK